MLPEDPIPSRSSSNPMNLESDGTEPHDMSVLGGVDRRPWDPGSIELLVCLEEERRKK